MKNTYGKICLIFFISMTLTAIIFCFGYLGILNSDILSTFLIQIIVMLAIPFLLYTILISKNVKTTFSDCGFKKISSKVVIAAILLGLVLFCINSFVSNAFSSIISLLGYENLSSSTSPDLAPKKIFLDFVLSALLPGFCEEFLLRGIMLNAGKKQVSPRYCLIVSSLLFGLLHLNIRQFFYATIMGALMGYVSLKADSIYPTIIIHFMNNFLSNYFVYGTYLNWPFARGFMVIENLLFSNPIFYIVFTPIIIITMALLYVYLVKVISIERGKSKIIKFLQQTRDTNMSVQDCQKQIDEINLCLSQNDLKNNTKPKFCNKIYLICSILLGSLITISSYIWGII